MSRTICHTRSCLPLDAWPALDQALWKKETAPFRPFDRQRPAGSKWCPATQHKYRRGWGRYLNWYEVTFGDWSISIENRVTPDNVDHYVSDLKHQGASDSTVAQRLAELFAVSRAFMPKRDLRWLSNMVTDAVAEERETRDTALPPFLSTELAQKSARELAKLMMLQAPTPSDLILYRNWLMILFLSVAPLRLKNFAATKIGIELRHIRGKWLVCFAASAMKNRESFTCPLPPQLAPALSHYLEKIRPALLGKQETKHLWINYRGRALSEHGIYLRVAKFTKRVLGQAINPHLFRHIAATTIGLLKPQEKETARALLAHLDGETTDRYYMFADEIRDCRNYLGFLSDFRKSLPGKTRRQAQPSGHRS